MNNLKFRAWDKKHKEMFEVIKIEFNPNIIYMAKKPSWVVIRTENEIELMQSTGLKDKNGVEIYEGDIIDVGTRIPFLNKIQRDEETLYLKLVPLDKRWTESYFTNFEDKSRYEVVGNIYEDEDKELLRKW